jgi:hypothetical protein
MTKLSYESASNRTHATTVACTYTQQPAFSLRKNSNLQGVAFN